MANPLKDTHPLASEQFINQIRANPTLANFLLTVTRVYSDSMAHAAQDLTSQADQLAIQQSTLTQELGTIDSEAIGLLRERDKNLLIQNMLQLQERKARTEADLQRVSLNLTEVINQHQLSLTGVQTIGKIESGLARLLDGLPEIRLDLPSLTALPQAILGMPPKETTLDLPTPTVTDLSLPKTLTTVTEPLISPSPVDLAANLRASVSAQNPRPLANLSTLPSIRIERGNLPKEGPKLPVSQLLSEVNVELKAPEGQSLRGYYIGVERSFTPALAAVLGREPSPEERVAAFRKFIKPETDTDIALAFKIYEKARNAGMGYLNQIFSIATLKPIAASSATAELGVSQPTSPIKIEVIVPPLESITESTLPIPPTTSAKQEVPLPPATEKRAKTLDLPTLSAAFTGDRNGVWQANDPHHIIRYRAILLGEPQMETGSSVRGNKRREVAQRWHSVPDDLNHEIQTLVSLATRFQVETLGELVRKASKDIDPTFLEVCQKYNLASTRVRDLSKVIQAIRMNLSAKFKPHTIKELVTFINQPRDTIKR